MEGVRINGFFLYLDEVYAYGNDKIYESVVVKKENEGCGKGNGKGREREIGEDLEKGSEREIGKDLKKGSEREIGKDLKKGSEREIGKDLEKGSEREIGKGLEKSCEREIERGIKEDSETSFENDFLEKVIHCLQSLTEGLWTMNEAYSNHSGSNCYKKPRRYCTFSKDFPEIYEIFLKGSKDAISRYVVEGKIATFRLGLDDKMVKTLFHTACFLADSSFSVYALKGEPFEAALCEEDRKKAREATRREDRLLDIHTMGPIYAAYDKKSLRDVMNMKKQFWIHACLDHEKRALKVVYNPKRISREEVFKRLKQGIQEQ